jgi:hypothetical protein
MPGHRLKTRALFALLEIRCLDLDPGIRRDERI